MKSVLKMMLLVSALALFSTSLWAQLPSTGDIQDAAKSSAESAAGEAQSKAEVEAAKLILKKAKPIPFKEASATLDLDDPNYKVAGVSVDEFMKTVIIPTLAEVLNKLPTGTKLLVLGHASSTGSETATDKFIGNKELSKQRAEAVLAYLRDNSQLDMSKFEVVSKGSSVPVSGVNPADPQNRRVGFDIK